MCNTVLINPITAPLCTPEALNDPAKCPPCTQVASCGNPTCGGQTCILCPGQDPSDLPASCGGTTACPTGTTSCANGVTCPMGTYCDMDSMCCIGVIL